MMDAVMETLNTFFYQLPAGRQLKALRQTRTAAEGLGLAGLLAALDHRIAEAEVLWGLEARWRGRKTHRVEHGQKARELDRALDARLSGLEKSLRARAALETSLPESASEARRCLNELFPAGLGAVINARFVDQEEATRQILKKLNGDAGFSALLEELGLSPVLEDIEAIHADYAASVGAGQIVPDFAEIDDRRQRSHEATGEIIARICGLFPTESADDRRQRQALLQPILTQNDIMRSYYKERRRGPETEETPDPDVLSAADIAPEKGSEAA